MPVSVLERRKTEEEGLKMRAESQALADQIEQSLELLRRHL